MAGRDSLWDALGLSVGGVEGNGNVCVAVAEPVWCMCARSMSAKLFNCSPEQLPSDLKANLLAMLQCGVNALEGYIRPGCLHLTLHAMVRALDHRAQPYP